MSLLCLLSEYDADLVHCSLLNLPADSYFIIGSLNYNICMFWNLRIFVIMNSDWAYWEAENTEECCKLNTPLTERITWEEAY